MTVQQLRWQLTVYSINKYIFYMPMLLVIVNFCMANVNSYRYFSNLTLNHFVYLKIWFQTILIHQLAFFSFSFVLCRAYAYLRVYSMRRMCVCVRVMRSAYAVTYKVVNCVRQWEKNRKMNQFKIKLAKMKKNVTSSK